MKTNTKLIAIVALVLMGLTGYAHTKGVFTVASNTIIPNRSSVQSAIKNQTTNNNSNARHSEGVKYDAGLGMLVFKDTASFNNTMIKLASDLKNFQYDNGKTEQLLDLLTKKDHDHDNDDDGLFDKLADNSPLSDTVLITFLNGKHGQQTIKKK